MRTLDELRQFYKTDLLHDLQRLEGQRLRVMRNVLIGGGSILGVGLVVGVIFLGNTGHPGVIIFALVLSLILAAVLGRYLARDYRQTFKGEIIRKLVHFVGEGLSYSQYEGVTERTFKRSELFKHRIDRYHAEDQVHGTLGATQMGFSEVHAEYKTRSDNKDHWHTIFKGLFFVADFNKHFHGRTVVLPDTAERLFGGLGKKLQSWNMSRDQLVKLEDPEFEREFVVYASDQIEVRYILSTSLMERILQFKRKTGQRIYLSFVGSYLFVAIPCKKNLFEPKLFTSLLRFQPIAEYVSDLLLGVGIVEDLNLNTRIWSKH